MAWCLIKSENAKIKKAFLNGELDPIKLAGMSSAERHKLFAKFISEENATQVNALFESKLLLKNQQAGMMSWAKRVVGITKETRMDIIAKIERMDKVLDPKEGEQFLQDLASKRLGIEVTETEAKNIAELSKKITDTQSKAREDFTFPTESQRIEYGTAKLNLETYINDLKLKSRKVSFREAPIQAIGKAIGELPGVMKSLVASMDNSFFGRQGIKTLYTEPKVWSKAFLKSWLDMGRELKGKDAMAVIKADVYSRPNALSGKYRVGGYGLDVLSEEAYPSSLPEKIPLFRRLYKASESAYNGGALRMRADLADRYIKQAEDLGVNTLVKEEARPIGNIISSLTGRGNLGKADVLGKELNVLMFSVKFLKSNVDTLLSPLVYAGKKTGALPKFKNKGEEYANKKAATNFLKIIGVIASINAIATLLNPNSTERDPRGTNFGKIKMWGHWVDPSGGLLQLATLASRLIPTYREGEWGFWFKNSAGTYTKLSTGKYGERTALDVFESFLEGKMSPVLGILRDVWKGQTFGGLPVTIWGELKNITTPLSIQNFNQLMNDPNSTNVAASMLLDALGFSVSSYPDTNIKSNFIPEGEAYKNEDFIKAVSTYAQALGTDPETALNRIFTGQKIVKVTNGTVMVERMPLADSTSVKKKANANNPQMKLDHTIPLELGGSNDTNNLKIVTNSDWSSYTKVENALGKALKAKKISKDEAQKEIKYFKSITDTSRRKKYGEDLIKKYK